MNAKLCLLSLAAACGLPALSLAQGTYLNAPGNNPSNAVVVVPGGNIGIGTVAPEARLDVWGGSTNAVLDLLKWGGSINSPILRVFKDVPKVDNELAFTILRTGNVGIGTPVPDARLDVWGGGSESVLDVMKGGGPTESPVFRVFKNNPKQNDTLSLTVIRSGNVGIGIASPQAKLDVAGDIRCTVIDLTSDRNAKTGFAPVDCRSVLERVARLPLTTWQYTNAPGVKHLGPMAQDFQTAFALGTDDKHIASVDADGVALAAIQALYHELRQRDEQLQEKESRLASLEAQFRRLEQQFVGNTIFPERMEKRSMRFDSTAADPDFASLPSPTR